MRDVKLRTSQWVSSQVSNSSLESTSSIQMRSYQISQFAQSSDLDDKRFVSIFVKTVDLEEAHSQSSFESNHFQSPSQPDSRLRWADGSRSLLPDFNTPSRIGTYAWSRPVVEQEKRVPGLTYVPESSTTITEVNIGEHAASESSYDPNTNLIDRLLNPNLELIRNDLDKD